jgi:hypothetical protein
MAIIAVNTTRVVDGCALGGLTVRGGPGGGLATRSRPGEQGTRGAAGGSSAAAR